MAEAGPWEHSTFNMQHSTPNFEGMRRELREFSRMGSGAGRWMAGKIGCAGKAVEGHRPSSVAASAEGGQSKTLARWRERHLRSRSKLCMGVTIGGNFFGRLRT